MTIFLDDRKCRKELYPFTETRHVADIRVGILTIRKKWQLLTGKKIVTDTAELTGDELAITANIIPTRENLELLLKAATNKNPVPDNEIIKYLKYPWHIFQYNDWAIRHDFQLLTGDAISQPLAAGNTVINGEDVFVAEGARVEGSMLNASTGPIYIGRNAEVMEGNLIRGPFALGESALLKMGSRIYGATSIGPSCVAGGEIKNSVLFEFSNKAHDGYLGDSVIGAWCNLGAGTSNSNVKNTGGEVKYFLSKDEQPLAAGNKAGLLMGDYSRAAINTSFNTGTIVGVCCNIFNHDATSKFVESFSWGRERYIFDKALQDIENWKKMKKQKLSYSEIALLRQLYLSN